MNRVRRYGPYFLHRSIGVEAQELQVMADVTVSGVACRAIPAVIQRTNHNTLPRCNACTPFTNGLHRAGHLVADDSVETDTRIHVAVEDMHVGPANSAIGDADGDFIRTGWKRGRLLQVEGPVAAIVDSGVCVLPHDMTPSCTGCGLSPSEFKRDSGSIGSCSGWLSTIHGRMVPCSFARVELEP